MHSRFNEKPDTPEVFIARVAGDRSAPRQSEIAGGVLELNNELLERIRVKGTRARRDEVYIIVNRTS
jgi:hypothetical protein